MENVNKILSDGALKGIYLGLALAVYSLIFWVFNLPLFSLMNGILTFVVVFGGEIAYMVIIEKKLRTSFGGKISFQQLFLYGFVVLFVAGLISLLFSHVLYHYIDPEFINNQVDMAYDSMSAMISDSDTLEKAMEGIEEGAKSMQDTVGSLAKMWIGPLVISLILALIIKKDVNELA